MPVVLDMYDGQKNFLGLGYAPCSSKKETIEVAIAL
jgi:hypothetical protein